MNRGLLLGIGTLTLAVGSAVAWSYRPSTWLRHRWARVDPTLEPGFMKELRLKQHRAFVKESE